MTVACQNKASYFPSGFVAACSPCHLVNVAVFDIAPPVSLYHMPNFLFPVTIALSGKSHLNL